MHGHTFRLSANNIHPISRELALSFLSNQAMSSVVNWSAPAVMTAALLVLALANAIISMADARAAVSAGKPLSNEAITSNYLEAIRDKKASDVSRILAVHTYVRSNRSMSML